MPPAVAAVAAWAAELTVAKVLTSIAINFVISTALSFISSALSPSAKKRGAAPALARKVQDNTLTVREAASPRQLLFGTSRSGGNYTFMHTTGTNNNVLHTIVTLAGHSVRSFDALYLDDEIVPLDSSGNATGKYAGKVKAIFGIGTTSGDSSFNSALTAAVGSSVWGANHRQSGCAKAYIAFTFDNNLFGGQLPNPSFVVSGFDAVADPRSSSGWTDNAALCIAQYLTDVTRGLGFLSTGVDQTALIAAANDCDEMVTRVSINVACTADAASDILTLADTTGKLRTGTRFTVSNSGGALPGGLTAATNYFWVTLTPTTGKAATSLVNARSQTVIDLTSDGTGTQTVIVNAEPRYTLNGRIDTADEPDTIMPKLLSSMAGIKIESGGQIVLLAGVWRAVTAATIDEQILDGGVSSGHRRGRAALFNGIKGTFINPDDAWIATDFPPVKPAQYLTDDGNVRSWRDAELDYTNSPSMAQRIGRIDLEKTRRQQTFTMPLTLAGMTHRAGDNVAITNEKRGWTDKSFFLTSWILESRDSGGGNERIGITITGDEIDATVYSWVPGTDESAMTPSQLTNLPSVTDAQPPTSIVLSSGTGVLDVRLDGTIFSRVKVAWTAPDDVFVTDGGEIQIQFKKSADSVWITGPSVQGNLTETFILDVEDGIDYDVRIRSVEGVSRLSSSWVESLNHTVIGKTAPPEDVTTFMVDDDMLSWSGGDGDLDFSGYVIRFHYGSNSDWVSAAPLHTGILAASPYQIAVKPQNLVTLMIKSIDTTGNESLNSAHIVANLGDPIVANVVENFPQAAAWTGTKTGSTVVGGELVANALSVLLWAVPDTGLMWAVPDTGLMWIVPTYEAMTYDFTFTPNLAAVGSNMTVDFALAGDGQFIEYRISSSKMWATSSATLMWNAVDTTQMWFNDALLPQFVPWPGSISAINEEYSFRFGFIAGITQGVATTFTPTIDVPDISESFADVILAAGGTRLTLANAYSVIQNVSVTLQDDGGAAVTAKIIDKNATSGPLLQGFDISDVGTSATVDATIQGF